MPMRPRAAPARRRWSDCSAISTSYWGASLRAPETPVVKLPMLTGPELDRALSPLEPDGKGRGLRRADPCPHPGNGAPDALGNGDCCGQGQHRLSRRRRAGKEGRPGARAPRHRQGRAGRGPRPTQPGRRSHAPGHNEPRRGLGAPRPGSSGPKARIHRQGCRRRRGTCGGGADGTRPEDRGWHPGDRARQRRPARPFLAPAGAGDRRGRSRLYHLHLGLDRHAEGRRRLPWRAGAPLCGDRRCLRSLGA